MSGRIGRGRFGVRRTVFALAAAALLPAGGATAETPAVVRHELAVSLHPVEGRLSGRDALTVLAHGAATLTLKLAPAARVFGVTVDGAPVREQFRDGTLTVPLSQSGAGPTVRVEVEYDAHFRDAVPEETAGGEDPGFGVRGSISERGVFLAEDACWYPSPPGGGRARFRVRVEAPAGIEAVTSGRLVRRATAGGHTVSEWETARPLPGISLAAGRYVVREKSAGGIPLLAYFFPEDEALAGKYLDAAARFLALYTEMFGPYPFEKFAAVENFFPTGYGFPS